jgi:hypothetical protein
VRAYKLQRPNGTWGDPVLSDRDLEVSVHRRMGRIDGPVHLSEDGGPWGPFIARGTGTDRLLTKTTAADEGHAFRLWNKAGKGVHVRVVNAALVPADTTGSPGVDLMVAFLNANFQGRWSSLGIYVYKRISGSSTWSDHSFVSPGHWCGRAIDVHPSSIAIGDAIVAQGSAEPAIAARLRYVLWRGVPNHYPGHIHWSFDDGGAPGSCR